MSRWRPCCAIHDALISVLWNFNRDFLESTPHYMIFYNFLNLSKWLVWFMAEQLLSWRICDKNKRNCDSRTLGLHMCNNKFQSTLKLPKFTIIFSFQEQNENITHMHVWCGHTRQDSGGIVYWSCSSCTAVWDVRWRRASASWHRSRNLSL